MAVHFTASARAQFLAAVASIRRHDPAAARRFRQQAERALKRLDRFPKSGAVVTEFPDLPFREVFVKPYRFFYRAAGATVWVVATRHGAQELDEPELPIEP